MELGCDLSKIQSEELLRKMWQQSEDVNRKKEIRSQLYKVRESRLRDLYQLDAMSDNRVTGFGKDPMTPSHGESLVDQSFQSLKSKEIRDSMSPTEMKFQSMALNNPSNTGWNVQSSSEVTPDGRGFRAETIATTDGVENINGGTAEFKGRNEQFSSAMHEGDDKNFRKQASESNKTHLQEKVVIGDENSGRTEIRTSSSTSTSSSKVFQSSSTMEYDNGQPVEHHHPQYLMDSNRGTPQRMQAEPQYVYEPENRQQPQYHPQSQFEPQYEPHYAPNQEVRRVSEQQQQLEQQQRQQYTQQSEQYNRNRQETNTSQNIETNETHEQNKRYVDMDKASPEYQRHVQHLMSQPGEIISNTVEYPKPNVKMITTVKRLPDGTIVRNKRYETEETAPSASSTPVQHTTSTRQTVSNQNTQRRDSQTQQQQQPKNYQGHPPSERLRHPTDDVVDNVDNSRRYTSDETVETKYSTVKTSNRKFSTETTSETIQEYDNGYPSQGTRPKAVTNDFSTQGFPSVRPNKPTQEFVTDKPQAVTNDFSTHGFPSVRTNKPTQEFATDRPQPQTRPTQNTPSQKMTSPPKDGLVPIRGEPTIVERRIPTEDGEVIIVSSEKKHSVKHQTNSERIVETDIRTSDDNRYEQITDVRNTNQDFSTHGFPSVKEPQSQPKAHPDTMQGKPHGSTPGYPSTGPGHAPANDAYPHGRQLKPQGSSPSYPAGKPSYPSKNDDGVIVTSQKSHTTKYNTNTERIIETEILGDDGRPIPRGTPRTVTTDVEYITDRYTVTTPGGDQIPQPEYPTAGRPSPSRDFSTQGFPSVRSPTKSQPDYSTQGFPSARDTHNKPSGSVPNRSMSPSKTQPSSTPTNRRPTTTKETTERVIQKEKEVDAAHRAFAASLRSSSPVDQTRRDSYSTDGPRHTPRSSVSSTKTFRREMREGSHDSETSRVSTTTVTRQTPPRNVGGRTVVVTERITSSPSPRGTKSPSPGKTVSTTTTTTTTRTASNRAPVKDVPKSDNQHTSTTKPNAYTTTTTTNNSDSIFPINHDSLTSITKKTISDNQSNNRQLPLQEVVEEPCIKKHYSLLGPSDHIAKTTTTTASNQESSPRSSPAPSSRSSHPYPPTTKSKSPLGEDVDTIPKHSSRSLSPSSFTSPRSQKTPKTNVSPRDQPKHTDDFVPREPKTIDRESTFEKIEKVSTATQRKTSRDFPIHVDDEVFISENYNHEDVDAIHKLTTSTKQLISHERKPTSPRTTTKTVVTKTPHEVQRTEVSKRIDRFEELKRPKQPHETKPSPKSTPSPSSSPRKSLTPSQPSKFPTKPNESPKTKTLKRSDLDEALAKPQVSKITKQPDDQHHPSEDKATKRPSIPKSQSPTRQTVEKQKRRSPEIQYPSQENINGTPQLLSRPSQYHELPELQKPSVIKKKSQSPSPSRNSPELHIPGAKDMSPCIPQVSPSRGTPDHQYPTTNVDKSYTPNSRTSPHRGVPHDKHNEPISQSPSKPLPDEGTHIKHVTGEPLRPRDMSPSKTSPERYSPNDSSLIRTSPHRSSPERQYPTTSGKPESPHSRTTAQRGYPEKDDRPRSQSPSQPRPRDRISTSPVAEKPYRPSSALPDRPKSKSPERDNFRPTEDKANPQSNSQKPIDECTTENIYRPKSEPKSNRPKSKSPERKYTPKDEYTTSKPHKPTLKPGSSVPVDSVPHRDYPSDEESQHEISEINITMSHKNVKKMQEVDILVGKDSISRPQKPEERKPMDSPILDDEKLPGVKIMQPEPRDKESKTVGKPGDRKPETIKTTKPTRPSIFEATAEQYIRNDTTKIVNKKNITSTVYEKFIDAERKQPQGEPKEPSSDEDDKEPNLKSQEPTQREPKVKDYDDEEPIPRSPQKPKDNKPSYSHERKPSSELPNEPIPNSIKSPIKTTSTTEKFIEAERGQPELPDGALISKSPEEQTPSLYPTYIKKGTTRSDTFEERCRHILGMENYGNTPGEYKKRPNEDDEELKPTRKTTKENVQKTLFEVKVEDCEDDDDDEPLSINSVKKILITNKRSTSDDEEVPESAPRKPSKTERTPLKPTNTKSPKEPNITDESEPEDLGPKDSYYEITEVTTSHYESPTKNRKTQERKSIRPTYDEDKRVKEEIIKSTENVCRIPDTEADTEPEDSTSKQSSHEKLQVTKSRTDKTTLDTTKYVTRKTESPKRDTYRTDSIPKSPHETEPDNTTDSEYETVRAKESLQGTIEVTTRQTEKTGKDVHRISVSKTSVRSDDSPERLPKISPKKPGFDKTSVPTIDKLYRETEDTMVSEPADSKPEDNYHGIIEVTSKRSETIIKDVTKRPFSTSPPSSLDSPANRTSPKKYSTEPKDNKSISVTKDKVGSIPLSEENCSPKRPTSKSPTRSGGAPQTLQPNKKTTEVTTKHVGSDITRKPMTKSPIRSGESPIRSPTRKETKQPNKKTPEEPEKSKLLKDKRTVKTTESIYVSEIETENSNKSDSEPDCQEPKDDFYESIDVTNIDLSGKPQTYRSPERSVSPMYESTKDVSYETIEVSNNKIDKSHIDITKKFTSKSPTRSPEAPRKSQPTKKQTDEEPKEPKYVGRKKPDTNEAFITTEKVYISGIKKLSPDSDSEPESLVTMETKKHNFEITKKPSPTSPVRPSETKTESPKKMPESSSRSTPKKPQEKSPIRSKPNVNEKFITTEKVYVTGVKKDFPITSESEPETKEETYREIIEVTKTRTNKSITDVTKKTDAKTPIKSPDSPKKPKDAITKKPTPTTKRQEKEPLNNRKSEKVLVIGTTSESELETKETYCESVEINKRRLEKEIDMPRKPTTKSSPIKTPTPIKESLKRTPLKPTGNKPSTRDDHVSADSSIKDRLRSSTRSKDKSPKKPDQVDAGSSPETSPSRHTERRRSSNISVNTEIIIEHTESDVITSGRNPSGTPKKSKDSVVKEIIDSTTLPQKLSRKMPVTERKESAPVYRVTRKDKDTKMSRSTSENMMKVPKKIETSPNNLTPSSAKTSPHKPNGDHRRPNKCFATKTINLSTTDRLISSEDMENVIIDIQHAKSSREPSPDKIVPTPVPAHLDTGKPRYPDVVQEPEDEPRRKPVVKNIPIFEEEHNTYVGCHITEVNRKTYERTDIQEEDLLCTPLVEAPPSLEYPTTLDKSPNPTTTVISDDECLMSVHDKVSKFQRVAEEVKKPKSSSPFHREFDERTRVPENDECLLNVHEKVDKFIKTAENLTQQPISPTPATTARDPRQRPQQFIDETDEDDLETTECKYTTVTLAPSEPQKSPELVRHISRHISRQSDVGEPSTTADYTHEMHEEYVSSTQEFVTHQQKPLSAENQKRPIQDDDDDDHGDRVHVHDDEHDDNEELIPHTAMHTIRLEERRQKDILTRPSVFDNRKADASKPTKPQLSNKNVSLTTMKDSEKWPQTRTPQTQPRAKPSTSSTTRSTATTSTSTGVNKRQPQPTQTPQQRRVVPNTSDCDSRRPSGNNVDTTTTTSVIKSSTINHKQTTKPYSINGPKKSPLSQPLTTDNKKKTDNTSSRQYHAPMHIPSRKSSQPDTGRDCDVNDDNVDYEEFEVEVVANDSETELIINSDTVRRSTTTTNKSTINKIPNTGKPSSRVKEPSNQPTLHHQSPSSRKMKEIPPGSISSPTPFSLTTKNTNKEHHVVNVSERSSPLKPNTNSTTSSTTTTTTRKSSETNESFLENRPPIKKTPTAYTPKPKGVTTTDSVAARRSLFENHQSAKSPVTKRPTPTSSPSTGRRPSYMDHTKSSLEHIRRDSLELNKSHYSRRPSGEDYDETQAPIDRNTQVKFDVPQKPRATETHEEINIEEIFELNILERLLETVTSYELRRRIRAQIRLVKKNLSNVERNVVHSTTTTTTTNKTNLPERSSSPYGKIKPQTIESHVTTTTQQNQQYFYKEEHAEDEHRSSTSTHTSPDRNQSRVTKPIRAYSPEHSKIRASPSERSPSPQRKQCGKPQDRTPSPNVKKQYEEVVYKEKSSSTRRPKQYYPIDDDEEVQQEVRVEKIRKEMSPTARRPKQDEPNDRETSPSSRRPSRKSPSPLPSSPERHQVDNSKPSTRSGSPPEKRNTQPRVCSKSPDNRMTSVTSARHEQSQVITKQLKRTTPHHTSPSTSKTQPESRAPVWADRKNVLKSPSSNGTPCARKPTTDSRTTTSSISRTIKSSTNQSQKLSSTSKSSYIEDDCITSSYGIGPTDENGLPLFGIRALKKKKQPTPEETCETTEEVTGYVVEEKYYSDNKSKPIVERKELIYSTNPEELKAIKEKVKESTVKSIKSDRLEDYDNEDSPMYTSKTTTSVRSSPDDFLETKYVRRGSVKEMSEKFIHKESSSAVSERSNNNYPKAGLILRTNSRKQSLENEPDMDGGNVDYYITRTQHRRDFEDEDDQQKDISEHFVVESESETESIKKTQREFKKITSTKSSSSRSFLNTKGEEITSVDDVLDRMRNADNVVEEGDTAEDQEARALLNKFLGASIIMTGVESTLPINRETKIITTTTTTGGKQPVGKHEVKTTRVTKSTKSGSSSSPVIETTCDIEEIWDEEILKQLLEQAKTYEERRKIRSRLRELMADRTEKNSCPQTGKEDSEKSTAAGTSVDGTSPVQRSESSASEYEEIIIEEEVTDDSSVEEEVEEKQAKAPEVVKETKQEKATPIAAADKTDSPSETCSEEEKPNTSEDSEKTEKSESETVIEKELTVKTEGSGETSEQGESDKLTQHQDSMRQQKMMQSSQANNQRLAKNSSSTYNKTTTASKLSSDRNMHAAPSNNKSSSSSAQAYAAASAQNPPPIVTVTAGRTDNISGSTLDLGNSSSISSQRQVDRLGVPQKEDSGTESGEDLRFIAAGLRDQLQMKSDSNIIDDVTCALSRLENSLKEGKDINVEIEKRKALLALIGRLQAGLTSPEKLAEIAAAMSELDGNDGLYGETSSPEADAHRSSRQRFAKRRNRIDRHTVGVIREELADARRFIEDMQIMENISNSTTPEGSNHMAPPQWFPLEKNASTGTILSQQQSIKQNNFLNENYVQNSIHNSVPSASNGQKRRPISGDFSVSFGLNTDSNIANSYTQNPMDKVNVENDSPDSSSKFSRFSNKKILMKRANTIDLSKAKRFNSDMDTDSEAEDKSQLIGLKRAVHPTVKKRVQNVVPPFEPKTENDRKFLAFINKQSDKPGLGWANGRSVSNWTTKFGSLKHTFEAGGTTVTAAKPPQVPGHMHPRSQQSNKQTLPARENYISTNQQIVQRLQQEAERQAEERRMKMEYERMEMERREREKLEHLRQQQQRERLEKERLEREYYERERLEKERLEREYYEREIRERNERAAAANAVNVPKPIPINEFKHAPQSVFRPIDNGEHSPKPIYRPIPQLPTGPHSWQAPSAASVVSPRSNPLSPNSHHPKRPDDSFITSPPPSSKSPIGLPWASKPTVDSTSFRNKANKFEERSKYDNYSNGPLLQRHHSLRSSNINVSQNDDYKKRPSLPNATDPYSAHRDFKVENTLSSYAPPPPTNISFVYNNRTSKPTYLSYPCLPTAVSESDSYRSREDSLTNPQAVPLILTNANPTYEPPHQEHVMQQQHYDIMSPSNSISPNVHALQQNTDYTDDDLDTENLMEYRAVSKVMAKPQSQTAVTVGRRTGHMSDDEVYGKHSKEAKSLLSTMKNIGNSSNRDNKRQPRVTKRPEAVVSPKTCLSPDGRSYQAPMVEPLFPDITKFESNRKPMFDNQKQQATPTPYNPNASYGQPKKQPAMYKSLENLAKRIPVQPTSTNPSPKGYSPRQPSPTTYVSEMQTSYVVTYPTDDTTDDEDHSKHSSYGQKVVNDIVPVRRSRNISETSTVSSTTASMTYANQAPSPNTNWTSNPIVADEAIGKPYYETPAHYTSQPSLAPNTQSQRTRPEESKNFYDKPQHYMSQPSIPANLKKPMTMAEDTQKSQQYNYNKAASSGKLGSSESKYQKPAQAPKVPLSPTQVMPPQYNNVAQNSYGSGTSQQSHPMVNQSPSVPTQKPNISSQTTAQKKTVTSLGLTNQHRSTTVNHTPSNVVASSQPTQTTATKSKKTSTTIKSHEKVANKTQVLANMRKTVSEDYHDVQTVLPIHKSQKTGVLKESAATKIVQQQSERLNAESRRKSLGSALEYQKMTIEAQEMYKSSAPSETPDIVKSSLPKDENQPILKKFGPPQRHHYVPNSYQSPLSNTDKSSSSTVHTKSLEVTSSKSILKTTQQHATTSSSQPTVVETPSTPQPDDDYIPRNIVFNNIHAFTSLSTRRPEENRSHFEPVVRPNKLSKSDSWNQIVNLQSQHTTASTHKFAPPPANELRRTKSGHTLSFPKMYEARVDKTEATEKQKTVAAYFSGQKSPVQHEESYMQQTKKSTINRTKTSEKISASRKSMGSNVGPTSQGGLARSATMPQISNLSFLDESNVEDAFEQLIMGSYHSKVIILSCCPIKSLVIGRLSVSSPSPSSSSPLQHLQFCTTLRKKKKKTNEHKMIICNNRNEGNENIRVLLQSSGGLKSCIELSISCYRWHCRPLAKSDKYNVNNHRMCPKQKVSHASQIYATKQQQSSTSTTEKTETKGKDGAVVTTTTKVTTRTVSGTGPNTVSPFAKFKQLDRQNSQQSTKSPTTPTTPGAGSSASPSAGGNAPMFKFTDPALNARAATVKEQLLQWCQSKTKEYENVQITNFSSSWVDGLAFCALIHHFLPDAFDYSQLTPKNRRKNFELAFTVADEKAGIAPLLDVEDMVVMKRPDWKCVFVYVQSIYRRFRNCQ
ncbi:uncharacterized protein LOC142231476 [Haematobia irritans]|uniref:uncharacterized protein LOC142231476 n=1 Tax=Haematobia irritans TaxID=7368 RepID=UPI003F4FD037